MLKNVILITLLSLIVLITSQQKGRCERREILGKVQKSDIKQMLDDLNTKRQQISLGKVTGLGKQKFPTAANMNKIFWNNHLAARAQNWLDNLIENCFYEHNPKRTFGNNKAGENMYYRIFYNEFELETVKTIGDVFVRANLLWWLEKNLFNPSLMKKFVFKEQIAHFSQLAWAKTTEIGCGFGTAYEFSTKKFFWVVVCNFQIAGNGDGKEFYRVGTPCSECENGSKCNKNFPGLCGGDGIFKEEFRGTPEEEALFEKK